MLRVFAKRLKRKCGIDANFLLVLAGMQWETNTPAAPVRSPRPVSNLVAQQTTSFPTPSYLTAERLLAAKARIKSRPETSLAAVPDTDNRRALMAKTSAASERRTHGSNSQIFANLTMESKELMCKLLRTASAERPKLSPMAWGDFLKVGKTLRQTVYRVN
jgi:hypothetical protein